MKHLLEADSIQLDFGMRPILSDIYIRCETGTITGLLGRNGAGKSCLLRILYGDLPATNRSVRFDGMPVAEPWRSRGLLLYLPQFNFIPGSLSLRRVLQDYQLELTGLEKKFPEFGGPTAHRSKIRDLSGGQRRLLHLYIILRSASKFALLDEPFTHLMPLQIEKVKEMLMEEKQNKGLLITDHLYRAVTAVSDRLYILANGQTHLATTDRDIETHGYAPSTRNPSAANPPRQPPM
jgi:ABC-type multidrug transport system ATPase subunit